MVGVGGGGAEKFKQTHTLGGFRADMQAARGDRGGGGGGQRDRLIDRHTDRQTDRESRRQRQAEDQKRGEEKQN